MRWPFEDRCRYWRDAATSQGMPGATERGRGEEVFSPRTFEGGQPCSHFDFRVPASRAVWEHISAVLSSCLCYFGQKIQEINIPSTSLKWGPTLLMGALPCLSYFRRWTSVHMHISRKKKRERKTGEEERQEASPCPVPTLAEVSQDDVTKKVPAMETGGQWCPTVSLEWNLKPSHLDDIAKYNFKIKINVLIATWRTNKEKVIYIKMLSSVCKWLACQD